MHSVAGPLMEKGSKLGTRQNRQRGNQKDGRGTWRRARTRLVRETLEKEIAWLRCFDS